GMAKRLTAAELHLCVERIIPWDLNAMAARRSIEENKHNDPAPHMAKVRRMGVSAHPLKMALETGKRWTPGKALGVQFMDGSPTQRARGRQHAQEGRCLAGLHGNVRVR